MAAATGKTRDGRKRRAVPGGSTTKGSRDLTATKAARQAKAKSMAATREAAVKKAKGGRQSIWSADLEDAVEQALKETGSMLEAAKQCGIHAVRVYERMDASESFRSRIVRAREIGYLFRAEQAVEDAKAADDAAKGRLALDADRWFLSKIAPKQFGDRVAHEVTGADGGPVETVTKFKLADLE